MDNDVWMSPTGEILNFHKLTFSVFAFFASCEFLLNEEEPTASEYCLEGPQAPVVVLLGGQQFPAQGNIMHMRYGVGLAPERRFVCSLIGLLRQVEHSHQLPSYLLRLLEAFGEQNHLRNLLVVRA